MKSIQILSNLFQKIPSFRGKKRIIKLLLNSLNLSQKQNLQVSTKSGLFELPNIIENISFDLFINGSYERGLVKLLITNIPKDGVFIDIGVNIGSITIPLAIARPDIKIIGIEASPWIFNIFCKNLKLNKLSNVIPVNHAVYNKSFMELPMFAPKEKFGKGSLRPVFTAESENVMTITVDDIRTKFSLNKVDYIKVDVEGFEICVFPGMSNTILRDKPKIIFEFVDWAETSAGFQPGMAQSFLINQNYTLKQLDENFLLVGDNLKVIITEKSANLIAT